MAISTGLERWLESVMLDENLLMRANADIESTFEGFDLSDEEKTFLKNPEIIASDAGIRPMIIRNINSFNKENINLIARLPEESAAFKLLIQSMLKEEGATRKQRLSVAANSLMQAMHHETPWEDSYVSPSVDKCDVRVVGMGMRSVDQISREALRAIKGSKRLFLIDGSPGIAAYFKAQGMEVIDLAKHYEEGKDRLQTYIEMAQDVVASAIDDGPVSFGLYGHPTVFAYPPFLVKAVAESCGLTVGVVPGISAMDCILAELMIDPATHGMQMFEATDVVIRRRTLLTDVQTLIWQIGALETGLYSTKPGSPTRFNRFVSHVTNFFPSAHKVVAIFASDNPFIPTVIYRFKLGELPTYADKLHGGFTLHIPPLHAAAVEDYEALELLKSKEYLKVITQQIDESAA